MSASTEPKQLVIGLLSSTEFCWVRLNRGDPIPRVHYLPEERATWATVLAELRKVCFLHVSLVWFGCADALLSSMPLSFRCPSEMLQHSITVIVFHNA